MNCLLHLLLKLLLRSKKLCLKQFNSMILNLEILNAIKQEQTDITPLHHHRHYVTWRTTTNQKKERKFLFLVFLRQKTTLNLWVLSNMITYKWILLNNNILKCKRTKLSAEMIYLQENCSSENILLKTYCL